jgi:hypothetical protein
MVPKSVTVRNHSRFDRSGPISAPRPVTATVLICTAVLLAGCGRSNPPTQAAGSRGEDRFIGCRLRAAASERAGGPGQVCDH